jgi:hypothetical protein
LSKFPVFSQEGDFNLSLEGSFLEALFSGVFTMVKI